ncbi:hypothetical protein HY041_02275 [Candidatus Roizmanbacteria bacterium]|nr:hypothetical protein [Candidatus Roizmanbacteria bacterium]
MAKEITTRGHVFLKKKEVSFKLEQITTQPIEIGRPENPQPGDILIRNEQIKERINEMAANIAKNHKGEKLLIVSVLTGATIFGAYLAQALHEHGLTDAELDFVRAESYKGQRKTSKLKMTTHPKNSIEGRNILLVEDIIDSGETVTQIEQYLINKGARSITSAALVSKLESRKVPYEADYTGFIIPRIWIEGFGLDTDEENRTNPHIVIGYERKKPKQLRWFEQYAINLLALANTRIPGLRGRIYPSRDNK